MSEPVSADVLRATILAGTVPTPATRTPLPTAWSKDPPEPGMFERDFAAKAPREASSSPAPGPVSSGGPLHHKGVCELLAAYAAGKTDPVATLDALTARIAGHPTGGDAVLAMLPTARAEAEDSARRINSGAARALEGIPFGVKDIIDVAGAPVTGGSRLTGDRIASADALVVARLRAQGAIPMAMLGTTEFASGSAHNPRYGAVRNPWDRERWTGGSSTGSGAMLAARLLPLALGSDTGGSIRVPSAWCGTTGLKPTRGLVPRTGVLPLSWSLDHIGPMARSAADLARVMPLIAGPDGEDPTAVGVYAGNRARSDLKGLRVGVPGGWFVELQDAAVLAAWRTALETLERLGANLVPVDLGDIEGPHRDGYLALMSELASLQEPALDQIDAFDAGTRARIEQGLTFSATDYLRSLRQRPLVLRRVLAAMEPVDVLVTPGLGCEAASLDTMTVEVDGTRHPLQLVIPRNTMIFDYTGLPALMLPSGFGRSGLPVAIQIVGKPFDDALCLSVGEAFQGVTAHHRQAPPEPEASA
jgi:aspartyl-tRNA(Asn)/glutamyl-tRNA(Gln) amidotransferase subunit A